MSKVAVVYWSGTGNTEAMAEQVAAGAAAAGAEVATIQAGSFDAAQAAEYTGIAFGCPAMGAEQLEEDEFEPMFNAVVGSLAGKAVGLFGSYGWGDGEWMRTWEESARGAGVDLACECVICCEAPDDDAQAACKAMGEALAK